MLQQSASRKDMPMDSAKIGKRPPNIEITAQDQGFFVRQANEVHQVTKPEDSQAVYTAWRCLQKGTFQALSRKKPDESHDITPECRASTWNFATSDGGQGRLTLFTSLDRSTKQPSKTGNIKIQATLDHPTKGYLSIESDREDDRRRLDPLLPGFEVYR